MSTIDMTSIFNPFMSLRKTDSFAARRNFLLPNSQYTGNLVSVGGQLVTFRLREGKLRLHRSLEIKRAPLGMIAKAINSEGRGAEGRFDSTKIST